MIKKIFIGAGIFFVALLIFFAWIENLPEPEGFPILEYHTVTKTPTRDSEIYNVPPDDFSAQLDYLQQNGYTTMTLQDFMRVLKGKQQLPAKPIVLTFDDGYADNFTEMLPILEAHNMTAVIYVITNKIGQEGYLNLEQLKEMQKRGLEIGSHTADHIPIDTVSAHILNNQIHGSKQFLDWSGLETIYTFSYPNGAVSDKLIDYLKKENFLNAVTGEPGLNNLETDPFKLKRIHIRQPRLGITEFKFRLWKANFFGKLDKIFGK